MTGRTIGIILAGGRSTRMGRDKALASVDGAALLDRARALLRNAGADACLVVGRPDEPDGDADLAPGAGPAAASRHALAIALDRGFRAAWILPVDMPLLTPDLLEALRNAGAKAVAYEGEQFPFYTRTDHPALATSTAASMFGLLNELGALRIAVSDPDAFANVNSPDDLAAAATALAARLK